MPSLVGSVLVSMLIDDMLKNDGGQEATKLMLGVYKRKLAAGDFTKMGSALARAAVKQAMKQGGRAITKNISKKAIKRLALRGAKTAAKGGAIAATGFGVEAGLNKLAGGGGGVKRKRKRRLRSGGKKKPRKHIRKKRKTA